MNIKLLLIKIGNKGVFAKSILPIFILLTILSGCASIFVPGKQKVTFITHHDSSVVYVNNEEFGQGKRITSKVKRRGILPVVVQTPGYKDINTVITPGRRAIAFWPLFIIDMATFYGGIFDLANDATRIYAKEHKMRKPEQFVQREQNQKFINIDAVKLNINDVSTDLRWYYVNEGEDIETQIEKDDFASEAEAKALAKSKKTTKKQLVTEDKEFKSDDTKYTESIYKTLKKTLFIDTINKVFQDVSNTIVIEGLINKGNIIVISAKTGRYYKARINILWYVKNFYGEKIDSINDISYSGEYVYDYSKFDQTKQNMFAEAVDNSFSNIFKSKELRNNLLADSNMNINDAVLSIKKPKNLVTSIDDAAKACVIVKRKDKGHGSGFAISNDGYILTNFHVVAGDIIGKLSPITVVLENGEEVEAQVVRYNPMRDIALIKVNKTFENAFFLNSEKTFKRLMDVYTIGTPKSIELGQTISSGIVSNERKANNNTLIQLNMSVNSGNSGGPLFDRSGILHGVIKSKLVGFATEGVSFAIPSSNITQYLNLKMD